MKKGTKTIKRAKAKQNNVPLILGALSLLGLVGYAAVRNKPEIDTSENFDNSSIEEIDYVEVETNHSSPASTTSSKLVYLNVSKGRFDIRAFLVSFFTEVKMKRYSNAVSMFEALNQDHIRYFHNMYLKTSKSPNTFYKDVFKLTIPSTYKLRLIKVLEKYGVGKVIKTRI